MAPKKQSKKNKRPKGLSRRNALILKVASFLHFINTDDHEKLLNSLGRAKSVSKIDILKILETENYVDPSDILSLKKACQCFAKKHKDLRMGALSMSFGFLTKSNLDLALEEQQQLAKQGENIKLGDLLVDAGMLSKNQKNLLLYKQDFDSARSQPPTEKTDPQEPFTDNAEPDVPDIVFENISMEEAHGQGEGPDMFPDMDLNFPLIDTTGMKEIQEDGIIIFISGDAVNAYLMKKDGFNENTHIENLKYTLEQYGIVSGLVDDDSLNDFINSSRYLDTFFEAAKGVEPVHGVDAKIDYLFEIDYLKPGELTEDGNIDYRQRGEIPFVAPGDVIAEKTPLEEGKDGFNIYGDPAPHIQANDIKIKLGKGVKLSESGVQVTAAIGGNPKLRQDGELSVNDAYFIEGDVDYTTGHIKFEKNVYITGTIKNGFKVEAVDVVANNIDGGVINAQGDVFIQNGATKSVIHALGAIKAGYLHRCRTSCMGNMVVVKEIIDSEAVLEGAFITDKGSVLSSKITAKGGGKIYNIGTDKAAPSSISVGSSAYIEMELERLGKAIEQHQTELEKKTDSKNNIEQELAIVTEKLKNFEDSKKRTLAMLTEMKTRSDKDEIKIALFQESLLDASQKSSALNEQKIQMEKKLARLTKRMENHSENIKQDITEQFNLKRIANSSEARPILDVTGKISSGTKVSGKHAIMVTRHPLSKSRIMEVRDEGMDDEKALLTMDNDQESEAWKMTIINL